MLNECAVWLGLRQSSVESNYVFVMGVRNINMTVMLSGTGLPRSRTDATRAKTRNRTENKS